MRFGCLASLALWSVLASLVLHSMVPAAIVVVLLAFGLIHRGLHSDWPLY